MDKPQKQSTYYEVEVAFGVTDVLDFYELDAAIDAARKWHEKSDLPIEIKRVTKERILLVE